MLNVACVLLRGLSAYGKNRRFYELEYDSLLRGIIWQGKGKKRERRLFAEALRDVYVLCQ